MLSTVSGEEQAGGRSFGTFFDDSRGWFETVEKNGRTRVDRDSLGGPDPLGGDGPIARRGQVSREVGEKPGGAESRRRHGGRTEVGNDPEGGSAQRDTCRLTCKAKRGPGAA